MPKQQPSPITPSSFYFLDTLKKNNNRDWFAKNKELFLKEQTVVEEFAEGLLRELNQHDVIETLSGKKSLYRVYRDVRFSNDKTPYKTHWSGSFRRAAKFRTGGYYFHIEPGNNFIGGGFWNPNPADLKLIRNDIAFDSRPLRAILSDSNFISSFQTLKGEQIKTTPKGFPADHEAIDLLRYKQFLLIRQFTNEEVLAQNFPDMVSEGFKHMRPFFDYMSEVLSTDVNGLQL